MTPLLGKLIPALAYVVVAAVVAERAWRFWSGRQSRGWPSVTGKVLAARIVRGVSRDASDDDGGSRHADEEYFEVEVRYEYRVRGKAYSGTRLSFGADRFDDYSAAIDALSGITAGREVPVFYDPKQPARAVLRTGNGSFD